MESATHRALQIPEVLHEIFSKLGAQQNSPVNLPFGTYETVNGAAIAHEHQHTLGALARCCRGFSDPALDVLWEYMGSLIPLFKVLGLKRGDNDNYYLSRSITPSRWARFELYARRMRHLKCDNYGEEVDDVVFLRVAQCLQGRPLLPSLHSLTFPFSAQLFHLASPSLKRLDLSAGDHQSEKDGDAAISEWIAESSDQLEDLTATTESSLFILPTIGRFNTLRRLELWFDSWPPLDPHIVNKVFTLRSLVELTLILSKTLKRPSTPLSIVTDMHDLRKLVLSGPLFYIRHALTCAARAPLASLGIYLHKDHIGDFKNSLNPMLFPWRGTLRSLSLGEFEPAGLLQDLTVIEPFFELRKLREFFFNPAVPIDFCDKDLLVVAKAWPEMEMLKLDGKSSIDTPRATLAALQSFALWCPKLRSLCLHLGVAHVLSSPRVMSHRLHHLTIYPNIDGDPVVIARYIDALFPSLLSVTSQHRYKETEVERMVKQFQMVRDEDVWRRNMVH
ncbi:hypothetical protein Hypma_001953 [Hypsizygus marmoreus]|uniref:F-box domain-containing protein n=1 Tax=Hypsizygus marmoreus TaxID=39966 RepID=A0A369J5E8_HYPMA|nr:hypothetical protein Hypma_001953 [Hypsizygus marmoreus]